MLLNDWSFKRKKTGRQTHQISNHHVRDFCRILFSHNGTYMAACSPGSGLITLWQAQNSFVQEQILETPGPVDVLALNQDGRLLASGHETRTQIRLWEKNLEKQDGSAYPGPQAAP